LATVSGNNKFIFRPIIMYNIKMQKRVTLKTMLGDYKMTKNIKT